MEDKNIALVIENFMRFNASKFKTQTSFKNIFKSTWSFNLKMYARVLVTYNRFKVILNCSKWHKSLWCNIQFKNTQFHKICELPRWNCRISQTSLVAYERQYKVFKQTEKSWRSAQIRVFKKENILHLRIKRKIFL